MKINKIFYNFKGIKMQNNLYFLNNIDKTLIK